MQLCNTAGLSDYFACRALDFIAGYPAAEGKLVLNPHEIHQKVVDDFGFYEAEGNARHLGRIKCLGYALAHAISIPLSPLIALVKVVALPILYVMALSSQSGKQMSEKPVYTFSQWGRECAGIVTSPLWNVIGIVRAALGIIEPGFYLKAPGDQSLSIAQKNEYEHFINRDLQDYI